MNNEDSSSKLEEQFGNELAIFRDLAVKSSDPLVVAKAVAVSDKGVQDLILGKLAAGDRLAEVFSLQGNAEHESQVFLRFVPRNEVAHFFDAGVLVFVDSVKGEVIGIVDPFVMQPERRAGRPFVTVASLNTSAFAASNHAMAPIVSRERAFFGRLGLGNLGRGGLVLTTDTVCNTDVTSTTYSGQPYRPDDTGAETTGDYCDSSGDIIA